MAERKLVTPKDFFTGAPPRLMGTEAEDHVSLRAYNSFSTKADEEDQAIKTILSKKNFKRAKISAFDYPDGDDSDKWLGNGQRMYEDCGLLESCTAEQLGPKRALAGTLAGIQVLEKLADASTLPVQIFRRSATVNEYEEVTTAGFHINHITPIESAGRAMWFKTLETHTATRLYTWEGMVAPDGFTLSQKSHGYSIKSDFYKIKEHNDHGFARIEDYGGDDGSPWGTFMAMATTSVLLRVFEHPEQKDLNKRLNRLVLEKPRQAIQSVSADTSLRETLSLSDSRRKDMTAIEIQTELADIASEFGKRFKLPEDEQFAVDEWQKVCRDLKETAKTGDIKPLATRVGWVSKKLWLERKNIGDLQANNPKAVHADMDWDSLYPKQGGRLQFSKRTGLTIVSESEVSVLVDAPPQDTRAAIRGKYIEDPLFIVYDANWSYVQGKKKQTREYEKRFLHPFETIT